jgi:hypothetical protein
VIRKPFEVADLGSLVRLCALGHTDALRGVVSGETYEGEWAVGEN